MSKRIYKKSEKIAFMSVFSVFFVASFFASLVFITAGCINMSNERNVERSVAAKVEKVASCTTWELANAEISDFKDETGVDLNGYQIIDSASAVIASSYSNDGRNDFSSFVSAWKSENRIEFDVYKSFSSGDTTISSLSEKFFTIDNVGSTNELVSLIKNEMTFSYFADIVPGGSEA